jgi:hypothetical protein
MEGKVFKEFASVLRKYVFDAGNRHARSHLGHIQIAPRTLPVLRGIALDVVRK